MLDTEIKIVWKGNCNYSCKKIEHKSQNSNMNALDNPHFVIKNWQMIKTKIWLSWENTWHFVTSPMGNGIWRKTTENTYWWHIATQILLVLLMVENLLHAISMKFLHLFFRRHFVGNQYWPFSQVKIGMVKFCSGFWGFWIESGTRWLLAAYFRICSHFLCILSAAFSSLVYCPSICHIHLLKVEQTPPSNPIENLYNNDN